MRATIKRIDDVAIVVCKGKITIGSGEVALRDAVHELVSQGEKYILLDLREVTTMDSSGTGELVSAYTTAANQGAKLALIMPPEGKIPDILTSNQLITVFRVFASQEEAVKAIRSESFARFYELNGA